MPLPISPKRLLVLAQNPSEQAKTLTNATDSEVMRRAVVGRIYYAAFLTGREKFNITAEGGVHTLVQDSISAKAPILGMTYKNLRVLRNVADYQFPPVNPAYADWEQNWLDAEDWAVTILDEIRSL